MNARSQVAGDRHEPRFYLPDFCAARSVLAVVLIAELVALLLSLGRHGLAGERFWPGLAETSLFLLWTGLGAAATLCAARGALSRLSVPAGSTLALALLLGVTGLVSEGAWWFAASTERVLGFEPRVLSADHLSFLLRNLMIGAIAGGLALRYFYVSQQWRRNVEAEAQSRVRALQARIRPHFLFNSMNAIAALTRTDRAARSRPSPTLPTCSACRCANTVSASRSAASSRSRTPTSASSACGSATGCSWTGRWTACRARPWSRR